MVWYFFFLTAWRCQENKKEMEKMCLKIKTLSFIKTGCIFWRKILIFSPAAMGKILFSSLWNHAIVFSITRCVVTNLWPGQENHFPTNWKIKILSKFLPLFRPGPRMFHRWLLLQTILIAIYPHRKGLVTQSHAISTHIYFHLFLQLTPHNILSWYPSPC